MTRVGVLALQGDVREHISILESLGATAESTKRPDQLATVDALIIPGGESTTIGKMAVRFGLLEPLRESIASGLPVYGTCAGLIFLASAVTDTDQPLIGALDVVVKRNASAAKTSPLRRVSAFPVSMTHFTLCSSGHRGSRRSGPR